MNNISKTFITLACVLAIGLSAVGIKVYKSNAAESTQTNGDVSLAENSEETESYTPEEQAYLAEMDKKLGEKFGLSTNDTVLECGYDGCFEVSYDFKKEIWEMLINDFELVEKPKEKPELVYGYCEYKLGNRTFASSGYYHDDKEYSYFLSYLDDNREDAQLYKVKEDVELDLNTRLWQENH